MAPYGEMVEMPSLAVVPGENAAENPAAIAAFGAMAQPWIAFEEALEEFQTLLGAKPNAFA